MTYPPATYPPATGLLRRLAARATGQAPPVAAHPVLPARFRAPRHVEPDLVEVAEQAVTLAPRDPPSTSPRLRETAPPTSPEPVQIGDVVLREVVVDPPRPRIESTPAPAVPAAAVDQSPSRVPAQPPTAASSNPAAPQPTLPAASPVSTDTAPRPRRNPAPRATPVEPESAGPAAREPVTAVHRESRQVVPAVPAVVTPPRLPALAARRSTAAEVTTTTGQPPEPAVHISIGRVEVRANVVTPPTPAPAAEHRAERTLSLSDYLHGRQVNR